MGDLEGLKNVLARALHTVKAQNLPGVCVELGLASGEGSEAFASKVTYVLKRLAGKAPGVVLEVAKQTLRRFPAEQEPALHELREAVRVFEGTVRLSRITRQYLLEEIAGMGIAGKISIPEVLQRLWPIERMRATDDLRCLTFSAELYSHTVEHPKDWTDAYVLSKLDLLDGSDEQFFEFLEWLVHPEVRSPDTQANYVSRLNVRLAADGFTLRQAGFISREAVFRVSALEAGVLGAPKNVIFAADGPKPRIVLSDAINNDITIVEGADRCLIYERPIPDAGLTWGDLVGWWADAQGLDPALKETENALYHRLLAAMKTAEQVLEKRLFVAYHRALGPELKRDLPALLPQVYLHYHAETLKELYGSGRLPRQRMDFLLLLGDCRRIVIEVDGAQHYSDNVGDGGEPVLQKASPAKYAEMVAADRQLRLCNYEVYRIGGSELHDETKAAGVVESFFRKLLGKHGVLAPRRISPVEVVR